MIALPIAVWSDEIVVANNKEFLFQTGIRRSALLDMPRRRLLISICSVQWWKTHEPVLAVDGHNTRSASERQRVCPRVVLDDADCCPEMVIFSFHFNLGVFFYFLLSPKVLQFSFQTRFFEVSTMTSFVSENAEFEGERRNRTALNLLVLVV